MFVHSGIASVLCTHIGFTEIFRYMCVLSDRIFCAPTLDSLEYSSTHVWLQCGVTRYSFLYRPTRMTPLCVMEYPVHPHWVHWNIVISCAPTLGSLDYPVHMCDPNVESRAKAFYITPLCLMKSTTRILILKLL